MICPLCAASVGVQQTHCPSCGAGLTEYAAVWYLPDQLFNEGVAALRRNQYVEAANRFAQVCHFRAHDDIARRAWAHACTRLGRYEEAATILLDVEEVAADPETDEQYALALAALEGPRATGGGPGSSGPSPRRTGAAAPRGTRRQKTSRASRRRKRRR